MPASTLGRVLSEGRALLSIELQRALTCEAITTPPSHDASDIRRETTWIPMRDGVRLATDLYLPPTLPSAAVAMRTPYGRADPKVVSSLLAFAQRGYVAISQDCRGTGDSEPDDWDYYVYEPEDGFDFVEWVSRQTWFDGFLGALGSSYVAQTQWCMALHPRTSTIVPEVGGLGVATNTTRLHMFLNAYGRSVGKGANKAPRQYDQLEREMCEETLAGGYFNEALHPSLPETLLVRYPHLRKRPVIAAQRWLWAQYCSMSCAQRAELIMQARGVDHVTITDIESLPAIFGAKISHDRHTLPHVSPSELVTSIQAPVLMISGWYDWGLNDALATWRLLRGRAPMAVGTGSRLIITPSAHNTPGYKEGINDHPELRHNHRSSRHVDLLLRWYAGVRARRLDDWPRVIYYLMGANEWQVAEEWPPPQAQAVALYLGADGVLKGEAPQQPTSPDRYVYDPDDPTPTVGGSIVSYVYAPGSCDVSGIQQRPDVLTYTTAVLTHDLDVVGQLRLIVYASSSAFDTDFAGRLSDVFPDGRAIQLQNGMLRARFRNLDEEPQLLEPGRIYRLDIDLWATANRFRAGHRLRLDISSADFPRFDRNTNRGGEPGPSIPAVQTIYHDPVHPSHLLLPVLGGGLAISSL